MFILCKNGWHLYAFLSNENESRQGYGKRVKDGLNWVAVAGRAVNKRTQICSFYNSMKSSQDTLTLLSYAQPW